MHFWILHCFIWAKDIEAQLAVSMDVSIIDAFFVYTLYISFE